MTRLPITLGLVSVLTLAAPAGAQETPHTIFAVDVSGSSTFLVDQRSATAAGAYVEKYIALLEPPHAITMLSVGDAGLARRSIDLRATVTSNRSTSAKRLAPQFGVFFGSLPSLFEAGEIAAQDTTSLMEFFQSIEPACTAGKATVIVFSDGLEWSSSVDGRAFATGKKALPKPDRAFLTGCEVKLLGVGQVKGTLSSDGLAERLIPQWRAYLTAAGAKPVTVVGSGFSF